MELELYLNQNYVQDYQNQVLRQKHILETPFEHAVLPDLFTEDFLLKIENAFQKIHLEPSPDVGEAKYAHMDWGAFYDPVVLKFVFGKEFQSFMSQLMGESVTMRAQGIPQYFKYQPGSRGMTVHNDAQEKNEREIVSLLQMSRHSMNRGGELNLHDPQFKIVKQIPPLRNHFTVFKISELSWHSVSDMHGDWTRELVSFDWYYKRTAGCP